MQPYPVLTEQVPSESRVTEPWKAVKSALEVPLGNTVVLAGAFLPPLLKLTSLLPLSYSSPSWPRNLCENLYNKAVWVGASSSSCTIYSSPTQLTALPVLKKVGILGNPHPPPPASWNPSSVTSSLSWKYSGLNHAN